MPCTEKKNLLEIRSLINKYSGGKTKCSPVYDLLHPERSSSSGDVVLKEIVSEFKKNVSVSHLTPMQVWTKAKRIVFDNIAVCSRSDRLKWGYDLSF